MDMHRFEKWAVTSCAVVGRLKGVEAAGRRLMIGVLAVALAVVTAGPSAGGQDEVRRRLEALAMQIPARPLLAPSFTLPGLDGTQVRLADLQGRVVMLYFWTTW